MGELGPGERPLVRTHYKHMLSEDNAVWTRFLKHTPGLFNEVWYDVHVGSSMAVEGKSTELEKKVALAVSRKRIDVVGRVDDDYLVIEVKPFGNMVALGQAITYRRLFKNEFGINGIVEGMVVCSEFDEDLREEYEDQGVLVTEVGFTNS